LLVSSVIGGIACSRLFHNNPCSRSELGHGQNRMQHSYTQLCGIVSLLQRMALRHTMRHTSSIFTGQWLAVAV
jgi:hypothetical protein